MHELQASESMWNAVFLCGAIIAGVTLGVLVPLISHRRGKVEEKIGELTSAAAKAEAEVANKTRHDELLSKNDKLATQNDKLATQNDKLIDGTEHIAKALSDAREELADAKKQLAEQQPRRLSPQQRAVIKEAIAPYAGTPIEIKCLTWDTEASRYANDFVEVFQEARWVCGPIENSVFPMDFENVTAGVKPGTPVKDAPAGVALLQALSELGLVRDSTKLPYYPGTPADHVEFRVGARASLPLKPPTK